MSQLYEIDSQGNKKIISGMVTGELPKYTMAEYTALTDKPTDWICTDYDATSEYGINDTEVKHGNTTVNAMLNKIGYTEVARGNFNQTYAQQLAQLQSAFNALSGEERMRSVIYTNGAFYYPSDFNSRAIYTTSYVAGGVVMTSLDIINKTRKYILNNFTIIDNSSDTNNTIMFLYVMDKMS